MILGNVYELFKSVKVGGEGQTKTRWINGRGVHILIDPETSEFQDLASGLSHLPAGVSTEVHAHRAEEIAIVVAGAGELKVGSRIFPLVVGDVVAVPSHVPHQTIAHPKSPLSVFWVYAPPEGIDRWRLREDDEEVQ